MLVVLLCAVYGFIYVDMTAKESIILPPKDVSNACWKIVKGPNTKVCIYVNDRIY